MKPMQNSVNKQTTCRSSECPFEADYERESVPTDSVKISDFTAEIKCLQPDAKIVLASVDVCLHS